MKQKLRTNQAGSQRADGSRHEMSYTHRFDGGMCQAITPDISIRITTSSRADQCLTCSLSFWSDRESHHQICSAIDFTVLMRQLSFQTNTVSEYSACEQKYYEDCRFAQGVNSTRIDCFSSRTQRNTIITNIICMFTFGCEQTKRRASQVSFCRVEYSG